MVAGVEIAEVTRDGQSVSAHCVAPLQVHTAEVVRYDDPVIITDQPDGQGTIPTPCVAGSIPARGAEKTW